MWKGTISVVEEKSIPFNMFLNFQSEVPTGYFLNGNEQTPIPEIFKKGDSLSILFSEFSAAMLGIWTGKEWKGKFFRYRSDTTWNSFIASPPEEEKPKSQDDQKTPTLVGKYQAYFQDENAIDSSTTANFWIRQDSIYGTLVAPDGDYGLLVGIQTGSHITLTRFTGWQAFILELEEQDNSWKGSLYARSGKPRRLTLIPKIHPAIELKSSELTTKINPKAPFTFSGINPNGQIINSTDSRFKEKVLIIDIMGTWCHNCMDAAPLLQQLYSEFNKDGLEIIGLAFEISDNRELAIKNLSLFQRRYNISYPLLFCGSTKESNVKERIHSQLKNFGGYPTTIFVNKTGLVHEIHVGFKGPATGEEYQQQVQQFYSTIKLLLK